MLHHTAHCAEKVVSTCLCGGSASAGSGSAERVGRGGGGWGHLQGAVHMVAAGLGFELLSPCRGLVSGKKGYLGSERVYGNR